ncbi:MAG TPA: transketolase, partial [Desulfobacterales bacterium]|nr:transketolase [Desulfobacterales bacterium]
LMGLKVIYIFTHDSIGLGEDGPTHQPIEQLASLRAIPNLTVLRPADANETAEAWKTALQIQNAPVALVLTRQGVPVLDRNHFPPAHQLQNGAYVLAAWDEEKPDLILIATGSEVHIALEAAQQLKGKGIKVRVVNIPSWELFDQQSQAYKEEVLPSSVWRRIVIEAGCGFGWHKYAGDKGRIIAVERFGASAPYKVLYQEFGLTKDRIVEEAFSLLAD